MRFRNIVATAVAAAFILLLDSVYGQRDSRPRQGGSARVGSRARSPRNLNQPGTRIMPADQQLPSPWVAVDWGLTLDDPTQALYQKMADVLSNYVAVPADRANYYSAYINNIGSWGGLVTSVQDDGNGGYLVTVSVAGNIDPAQLENDQTGNLPSSLLSEYSEIYNVDAANAVTYLGPSIPAGSPDQVSWVAM